MTRGEIAELRAALREDTLIDLRLRGLREADQLGGVVQHCWSLALTMVGALPAPERPAYVEVDP